MNRQCTILNMPLGRNSYLSVRRCFTIQQVQATLKMSGCPSAPWHQTHFSAFHREIWHRTGWMQCIFMWQDAPAYYSCLDQAARVIHIPADAWKNLCICVCVCVYTDLCTLQILACSGGRGHQIKVTF